jgi:L-cysteine desulfidase
MESQFDVRRSSIMTKEEMLQLLHVSVAPSLGCTETVCAAIAASAAAAAVGGTPQFIALAVSRRLYKNGMSAKIAGFHGNGLDYAAALGAYISEASPDLEIMNKITPDIAAQARQFVSQGSCTVTIQDDVQGVYVRASVQTELGTAVCLIEGYHANIRWIQVNGSIVFQQTEEDASFITDKIHILQACTITELRQLAASASEEELHFLLKGHQMNERLAGYGLTMPVGSGIGHALFENSKKGVIFQKGLMETIVIRVAAAMEARLDGCPYTAMSSAGSGAKGIAVILPIMEVALSLGVSRRQALQAVAFGHLVNAYISSFIGKRTVLCSCALAASTAASAAITWLLGGGDREIAYAIRNMTGSITGMICDGGKTGCALKIVVSTSAALSNAVLASQGVSISVDDGICAETPEQCIRNMSEVGQQGMVNTDKTILDIIMSKK